MSRLTRFSLMLLGVSLVFLALTFFSAGGKQLAQAMRLASNSSPTCYTWSFLNNTDQDANDLHLRLAGMLDLTSVYTGTLNPFGAPDPTSGYDPATQTYHLNFSNASAATGDRVTIGFCSDSSEARLDQPRDTDPATWTLDGQPLQPAPLFTGLKWHWQDAYTLQVTLYNSTNITLTLQALNLLEPDVALSLEDMTGDIAAMLPMTSELAPDVLVLAPGSSMTFDVPAGAMAAQVNFPFVSAVLQPMRTYVLQAMLAAEDDPGNVLYLISQSDAPPLFVFMPLLRR